MRSLLILVATLLVVGGLAGDASWLNMPLWPQPKSYYGMSNITVFILPTVQMEVICSESVDLVDGFNRFVDQTFTFQHGSRRLSFFEFTIKNIQVCMGEADTPLTQDVDESYTITVTENLILLQCASVYGCYHAFTTLGQLIAYDFKRAAFTVERVPVVVNDAPRFPHRGLLLDSSRHWQPKQMIYLAIDSLVMNKMNVLHWHLTDFQAFPYVSKKYPQLVNASYSPMERYNAQDIKDVVEYGRKRGVRIMVEMDTPGHIGSLYSTMPEIFPEGGCANVSDPAMYYYALDFTKNITYEVMENLWKELLEIFPEHLVHIGGDEVNTSCWKQKDYIHKWCKQHNMTVDDGTLFYLTRLTKFITQHNRSYAGWQELWENFGTKLPKGTVIQQWLPHSVALPKNVTSHGYRLIWSDSSVWYLDHRDVTWYKMYDAEPCKGLTRDECSLVLGGEGCMWGETVDASNFVSVVYPRLSAIAERLWSPEDVKRDNSTLDRMESMRCHMIVHGVNVAPVRNVNASDPPTSVAHNPIGSCFRQ